ncbi:MAG: membrane-bound lytic murein transglycosylase MltF [Chromatiaceae bacterium]|nr:membrane-bound lytic murein transglycosylase MltF [Chromatiaceae bacterium]
MKNKLVFFCLLLLLLESCSIPTPLLERVRESGELRVVTRSNPTTYYQTRRGIRGLEYELVSLFAKELGVEPRFLFTDTFDQILPMVTSGDAHFAAAGLSATRGRESHVRFTHSYQSITQQLVYHESTKAPKQILDTLGGTLEVVAGSNHEERLREIKLEHPELEWSAQQDVDSEELLTLVVEQLIDYTVANSNEVALSRRFHPELKVAFDISEPQPLAWAFPHAQDNSLFNAAQSFLKKLKRSGKLAQIIDRYYGHADSLGALDTRTFRRHIAQRLPAYSEYFKEAAKQTGIDWRLLAAIGYQESHWNPKAVSPTGVQGIMMLTKAAAKELGVKSRTNPKESILGGAHYILQVREKIPERIPDPDRLWMTLAGYNIGFGHLEDARILTQRRGGDPDRWVEVKNHLPLLSQKEHYTTVKHGKARGQEPVSYVENIRGYYDLLVWENNRQEIPVATGSSTPSTSPATL